MYQVFSIKMNSNKPPISKSSSRNSPSSTTAAGGGRLADSFNCVVCSDESDAARNMCRACRYQRCLERGMLTTAVQHSRDGLGKRKEVGRAFSPSSSMGSPPDSKPKTSSTSVFMDDTGLLARSAFEPYGIPQQQGPSLPQLLNMNTSGGNPATFMVSTPSQSQLLFTTAPTTTDFSGLDQAAASTILQIKQQQTQDGIMKTMPSYIVNNFAQLQLDQTNGEMLASFSNNNSNDTQSSLGSFPAACKHLHRMVEGYNQFLSLRKASYTLVDGLPLTRTKGDQEVIGQSNFGTAKQVCRIESSLVSDIIEKHFLPYSSLPKEDQKKLSDSYFCRFSNAERCYRTYKMFNEGDERIMMPDGGYVRLSELEKFYANNSVVRGDPAQIAKIFESAMRTVLRVAGRMRKITLSELELVVLFGLFLWNDSEVSPTTADVVYQIRSEIIIDLHLLYRSQGYSEAGITLKTSLVRVMKENFHIAELFNMLTADGSCCPYKYKEDD